VSLGDHLLNRTLELMARITMPTETPFVCVHIGNGQWKLMTWGLLRQSLKVVSINGATAPQAGS
jgi:hypothetical protein